MSRHLWITILCTGLAAGACTSSPAPELTQEGSGKPPVVGCIGVGLGDCDAILARTAAALPPGRGLPASVEVVRASCDGPRCGPGAIAGQATYEWVDGGEPALITFEGQLANLQVDIVDEATWSGIIQPRSKRVAPGVPVSFTLGHCGLLHMVDFDGSFWVPVGELDPDAPQALNAAEGEMQLVAPNRAQFSSGGKLIATLARFPGPKHVWLCD